MANNSTYTCKSTQSIYYIKKLIDFYSYILVPIFLSKYPEKKMTYVSNKIVIGTIKKQSVCSIELSFVYKYDVKYLLIFDQV